MSGVLEAGTGLRSLGFSKGFFDEREVEGPLGDDKTESGGAAVEPLDWTRSESSDFCDCFTGVWICGLKWVGKPASQTRPDWRGETRAKRARAIRMTAVRADRKCFDSVNSASLGKGNGCDDGW